MDKQKDLDQLFSELQSFLKVLDTESLSCVAESKKESVTELLQELNGSSCPDQPGFLPAEDADYMFMSCVTLTENRSEMEIAANANECRNVLEIIEDTEEISPCPPLSDDFQMQVARAVSSPTPHQPNEVHPDDSYEEAELLSPLAQCSAGGCVETDGRRVLRYGRGSDCADSDSSHYESYGEEDVSGNNRTASLRWLPTDSPTRPLPHSRICGFLWRKKWLGQWTKQLFLIRDQVLMCYKCLKDQYPLMELSLLGSRVAYKFKRSKKIQHELKITTASNETVVLGLQSREQTEDWRKVVEEVSSNTRPRASPWNSPKMPGTENKCASNKASSPEDRDRWLSLLQARCGTDTESMHLYEDTVRQTGTEPEPSVGNQVSGLLQRRITTPNTYMDDPFGHVSVQTIPEGGGSGATRQTQRVDLPGHEVVNRHRTAPPARDHRSNINNNNTARYNTLPSAFPQASFFKSWSDFEIKTCGAEKEPVRSQATQTEKKDFKEAMDSMTERRALPKLEEKIRRLEQAVHRAKERVKSGSELNLLSLSKTFKRASCGQSVALFSSNSDTANPQVPIASPSLRRTASAKGSLRRTPSVTVVEKGRVLRKTKEWEMKSSV
ncbi:actin filament-associated protein 1-like 1 isoform X5 [Scyliorhinus torazame]|uniref:actin filament-associated protein 1-like 1 isoform X5 n=1 Tax=Scyliorhinus torazame TaxID=75743 RepID=UPI003B5BE35C